MIEQLNVTKTITAGADRLGGYQQYRRAGSLVSYDYRLLGVGTGEGQPVS